MRDFYNEEHRKSVRKQKREFHFKASKEKKRNK